MNWTLLRNSLAVSALSTLLATGFGLAAALWLAGLERRWRNALLAVSVTALALPPFLVTNCWLDLLGLTGRWHRWLPLSIYSLGGAVWILALLTWPITLFLVLGAWQRLDPSQLDSDPALAGWPLVRWLLLPLARSALTQAAALTFALGLNNFAVPSILQVKVFPAELWVSFNTQFDYTAALELSWPLVLAPMLVLLWFRRREVAWPRLEGGVAARHFRRQLGGGWSCAGGGLATFVMIVSVGLPLAQLLFGAATWLELPAVLATGRGDLLNSFNDAAVAATLCILLALAGWRRRIGLLLWIPFLMPGVLLGIALIYLFNRPVLAVFYQGAGIVILALTIRYLALGWNTTAHALRTVDRDLSDAARLSGASGWQVVRSVHWPQISAQLAAAWYVTYLLCLWDVETLVLIIPAGGETAALRVFNLLHYGHTSQVNTLCLLLLVLAVAPLLGWWLARAVRARTSATVAGAVLAAALGAGCEPASPNAASLDSKIFSQVQVIGSRGTGLGQFNKPRSVAVDRHDNLYVVDMTGRVQKFSPAGVFLGFWQMPQTDKGKPKGMCRDSDGNIVVVEPHYSRVNHFTPDGKLAAQWGVNGTHAGQLFFPRSAAVNAHGEIYVSEYGVVDRVQRFTAQGKQFLNSFGVAGPGPGQFSRAEGLGVDAEERVYVADSCNHRIQIFTRAGRFLRAYGRPGTGPGEFNYPYDVRVDAAGLQFVCEFGNSRIQVFDAHDQLVEILGGVGTAPGQFFNPWSIELDSAGNLYVADAGNHRVQKFVRREPLAVKRGALSMNRPSPGLRPPAPIRWARDRVRVFPGSGSECMRQRERGLSMNHAFVVPPLSGLRGVPADLRPDRLKAGLRANPVVGSLSVSSRIRWPIGNTQYPIAKSRPAFRTPHFAFRTPA